MEIRFSWDFLKRFRHSFINRLSPYWYCSPILYHQHLAQHCLSLTPITSLWCWYCHLSRYSFTPYSIGTMATNTTTESLGIISTIFPSLWWSQNASLEIYSAWLLIGWSFTFPMRYSFSKTPSPPVREEIHQLRPITATKCFWCRPFFSHTFRISPRL